MQTVTVKVLINAPIEKAWECFTSPEHITQWNFASPEWHCPTAEHDLKVGGKLKYHMAAKDGSMAFDYTATFTTIKENDLLAYTLDDNRKVSIAFTSENGQTKVVEQFETEDENSIEMQKAGWQAILNNFKAHVEAH